jgi:hypothetical protein
MRFFRAAGAAEVQCLGDAPSGEQSGDCNVSPAGASLSDATAGVKLDGGNHPPPPGTSCRPYSTPAFSFRSATIRE